MRAILEDIKTGDVSTYDVPEPELRAGGILVRTHYSAISSGTERVMVEIGEKSLLQKAMSRPDLVKQVVDYARINGVKAAYEKVQSRLDSLSTMGYSTAGVVLEVGEGVTEFQPGDRVACAGVGYANHCEINFVPKNLACKVPANVSLESASLTTIGAIALQGFRQAAPNLGETVLVVGAGLLGILSIQMARAAGCRVVAIDLDPGRAARSVEFGSHLGLAADDPSLLRKVREFSRYGADVALITAASKSPAPVETAASLMRDRGRLVIVGDVGMGVQRAHMFKKELSLLMSRSYGPGRYDPAYEEGGADYPIGYVRWTEKRNMEAFLDLLASGSMELGPLLKTSYPVEDGARGYSAIIAGETYTAVISYAGEGRQIATTRSESASPRKHDHLRIGCIGAGNFARGMIFPKLRGHSRVRLQSVATASGVGAESARRSFHFEQAQTAKDLLRNPDVDAVFVLSRHASHAPYVTEAIKAGKKVFVEKPLAIDHEQLAQVASTYRAALDSSSAPFLMVGFNRRFAPATLEINRFFAGRREPMMVQVRVNAGSAPKDSWVHGEGGRIIGEFCHFVDWARAVVGVPVQSVAAHALPDGAAYCRDNVSVTLTFSDGSLAQLSYLANGDRTLPKEFFEVFCEGGVARLEDFSTLLLGRQGKAKKFTYKHDKGHANELRLTADAMANGTPAPIPFSELIEVSETTIRVLESIRTGLPVALGVEGSADSPARV